MGMLLASVGALSTFYPEANAIKDEEARYLQVIRLIAKMPTLAAFSFRHNQGKPYVYPDNDLSYPGNFLGMIYKMTELKYEPDPRLEHALDVLFILHADHEQNCSTSAVRSVGSSQVDPYSAVAAGVGALYGPLHGGANEQVLKMLRRIERKENIPDFLEGVKEGEERLMGFGHRVYKNYDPRAKIIQKTTYEVFEVTGTNPLLEIALELEKIALDEEYFVERKLYPNVDFYSGIIYEALGMPVEMFPVLFAIGRTAGWIAQWLEMIDDSEQKIARPRQLYTGERGRDYVPIDQRLSRSWGGRSSRVTARTQRTRSHVIVHVRGNLMPTHSTFPSRAIRPHDGCVCRRSPRRPVGRVALPPVPRRQAHPERGRCPLPGRDRRKSRPRRLRRQPCRVPAAKT